MCTNPKIKKAEQAIRDRFIAIEAALNDLSPNAFGDLTRDVIDKDNLLQARYQNRLMSMFLLIYHLRDDVCRLVKRRGLKKEIVGDFIKQSLPVSLCIRVGDTHKHGLGGRSKNATIPNGLIVVYKTPKGTDTTPSDKAIVIGMALVDSLHGVFHSHVVIEQAVWDWIGFLAKELKFDLTEWLKCGLQSISKQIVNLPPDAHATVQEGSVVAFELPKDLSKRMIKDVKKRAQDS
ncbi:MAG: hypothetical protein FVQ85_15420 [Planctomycetes bacterium]|nr:hypothetical protein [Planctomycetota bacterium]